MHCFESFGVGGFGGGMNLIQVWGIGLILFFI
jgi:hypothetical protein